MDTTQKSLTILNLTGELSSELDAYFENRQIKVVNPLAVDESLEWTHIIIKDLNEFSLLRETYQLLANDIKLISLSQVGDLQSFVLNNGNLIIDELWMKTSIKDFILDKYFQGYGGISLGDNYPSFKEQGSFNIVNPFNTGEYLDRLVHQAFSDGLEALSIKTFFDHLTMYISGLKTKGVVGLPIEVSYGVFDEIFGVQFHFYAKDLQLLDVVTGLSSTLTKKAEEYFLNMAVQSTDFFDFSYMPEVNKIIVTGLWTKDPRIKFENRGLLFSSIPGTVKIPNYESTGATSFIVPGAELEDLSDMIIIPNGLAPEVLEKQVIKGTPAEKEFTQVVKGSTEKEEEARQVIKGEKALAEVVNIVRGKFEEEKSEVRIAGTKLDVDKFAVRIAASIEDTSKQKNLVFRSTGHMPETIKTGLFDFAKNIKKQVEDLSDSDLDKFQIQVIPQILKPQVNLDQSAQEKLFETKFKTANVENEKLKNQLKTMAAEVRILKDARAQMAEIQAKVAASSMETTEAVKDGSEELRKDFQKKLEAQSSLSSAEYKKLAAIVEGETKLVADLKQEEMKNRKLQIEATQKDAFFAQEIEKSQRLVKSKDLVLLKTKESFTKLIEKKDSEVSEFRIRLEQLSRTNLNGASQKDAALIRDLEKQNQNLVKMTEMYKTKITSMATNMDFNKSDDGSSKDEARKLHMLNTQLKNQLELNKKEVTKLQEKTSADNSLIQLLKIEKAKLEQLIKKVPAETDKPAAPVVNQQQDQELKRALAHTQILETQLKDSAAKILASESKIAELIKIQKATPIADDISKVKIHLENSVKKLTQDLIESRNQMAEMKKETNKLRQEKTALQNQLDKAKKDADKGKPVAPKKPGAPGKAA